jgi:hypothetical protein
MDPVTITLIIKIAGTVIGVLVVWPWILDFFSTKIIPWVREAISGTIADLLADIVIFADKSIVPIRRTAKQLWGYLKQNILGIRMEVTKTSATTAVGKTTMFIRDADGKLKQTIVTEELAWDDLPDEMRSEINRQNTGCAEMDLKKPLEDKFQEQARTQGIALEMVH